MSSNRKPRKVPPADLAGIVDLDPALPCSLTDQLFIAIRDAAAAGVIAPGARLPATRTLARTLRIGRNTVLNAYDELRRQGVITSRRGSGTVIADAPPEKPRDSGSTAHVSRRPDAAADVPCNNRNLPVRPWCRAMRSSILTLAKSNGTTAPVREVVAQHLRVRGVRCGGESVFLVPSRRQALDICLRIAGVNQPEILIEDPGNPDVHAMAILARMTPYPLPVDALGANIAAALRDTPSARIAYVTPAHQNPTGLVMNEERRAALLLWADLSKGWIIEDDSAATLRRVRQPSLYTRSGRTLHIGTFAYALAPLSSMAYLVVPDAVVARVTELVSLLDIAPAPAEQFALRQMILSRAYQRALEAARVAAEHRHAALMESCRRELLWFVSRVTGAETGERVILWLQHGFDVLAIANQLRSHGIPVERLQERALGPVRDALILRLHATSAEEIDGVIREVSAVVRGGCLQKTEAPRCVELFRN